MFQIGDRGNLWIPDANNTLHGPQIGIDAAQNQKAVLIELLQTEGWNYVGSVQIYSGEAYKDAYADRAHNASTAVHKILTNDDIYTPIPSGWEKWEKSYEAWLYDFLQRSAKHLTKKESEDIWNEYR